jgi:hypothetical protein
MNQLKRKRSNGGGVIKRKTNVFADTTSMTGMILNLITTETETPKNMTKGDGVGMTQTSVPKVNASGESDQCGGGGGRRMHRIELVGAVTSVKYHPGSSVLDTKTKLVKINSNRIFTSETTNENKILNKMR